MVNPSSPAGAGDWPNRQAGSPAEDPEITRLKERLGFYESFDQLIQENVSRASELLKLAAGTRETAEHDLARARSEVEELRAGDRQGYRLVLSGLLDDVTSMQVQIERLARRVSDALDDVEAGLPAGGELGQIGRLPATAWTPADGFAAASEAPAFPLDPTPDEIGPPEPFAESEAAFRGIVADTGGEVAEAEAALAQAAEAPFAAQAESDPELIVDEVVQPAEDAAPAPAPQDVVIEPAAGDGVLSDEPSPARYDTIRPETADGFPESEPEPAPPVTPEDVIAEPAPEPFPDPIPAPEPFLEPIPDAAPEPALAAAPPEEPAPEPAGSRLPWIAADVRPFSLEGTGSGVRPPGMTEPSTPYSLPQSEQTEPAIQSAPPAPVEQPTPWAAPSVSPATEASAAPPPSEPSEPSSPPEPASSSSPLPAAPGVATAVLVHGVPRATTALSLKRYLEGLGHVTAVEPREYAEGILRLHVIGERPVQIDDLRGWSDGGGLEPVHLRDDLIEVRLPH